MNRRVSAIVSSFNRPEGLRRSLESVIQQTIDAEIIVCDDASTDQEVMEILEDAEARFGARIVRGEPVPVSRKTEVCTFTRLINRAMDLATGDYVSYLTDGNAWLPDRCAEYVKVLDTRPDIFLVWGMVQNVRDGVPQSMPAFFPLKHWQVVNQLRRFNIIDHSSVMHRRTAVRWGEGPESWRCADWLFWKRLLAAGHGKFVNLPVHGEVFYDEPDSLGRSMVERGEALGDVLASRAEGG